MKVFVPVYVPVGVPFGIVMPQNRGVETLVVLVGAVCTNPLTEMPAAVMKVLVPWKLNVDVENVCVVSDAITFDPDVNVPPTLRVSDVEELPALVVVVTWFTAPLLVFACRVP